MPVNQNSLQDSLNGSAPKGRKSAKGKSDRHAATTTKAQEASSHQVSAIALANQAFQGKISSQLQRVADEREQALEQVSDVLSFLYSPSVFQSELMARTAEKLGIGAEQAQEDEPIAIDLLADSWGAFGAISYPELPGIQSSVLGCLPC